VVVVMVGEWEAGIFGHHLFSLVMVVREREAGIFEMFSRED